MSLPLFAVWPVYVCACLFLCLFLSCLPAWLLSFMHSCIRSLIYRHPFACWLVNQLVSYLISTLFLPTFLCWLARQEIMKSWESQINSFPPVVNRDVATTRPFLGCTTSIWRSIYCKLHLLPIQSCCCDKFWPTTFGLPPSQKKPRGGSRDRWRVNILAGDLSMLLSLIILTCAVFQQNTCKVSQLSLQNDPLSPCLPLWRRSWWSWAARVVQQLLNYLQLKKQQGEDPDGYGTRRTRPSSSWENLDPLVDSAVHPIRPTPRAWAACRRHWLIICGSSKEHPEPRRYTETRMNWLTHFFGSFWHILVLANHLLKQRCWSLSHRLCMRIIIFIFVLMCFFFCFFLFLFVVLAAAPRHRCPGRPPPPPPPAPPHPHHHHHHHHHHNLGQSTHQSDQANKQMSSQPSGTTSFSVGCITKHFLVFESGWQTGRHRASNPTNTTTTM